MAQALLESPTSSADGTVVTPTRAAWTGLALLTLINLFNYLDRYVVPAIGESLKHSEIRPTDEQFGFLASGFIIVYMIAAPFIGAFADRGSRPRILALGVGLWSIATAAGGLASSYGSLLASRAAVGIGEAAYGTIAPALLADYFPERLRGRVFAIFFAATPVGSALGYVVGGLVDKHYGWRHAFYVAGLPGLLLAFLALSLYEPRRRSREGAARESTRDTGATDSSGKVSGIGRYVELARNRLYRLTILGYAAYTFALGGIAIWMPTFLERVRGLPRDVATVRLGAILVITGFVGTFIGGWVGDYLLRRTPRAYLWVSGVATLAAAPAAWLALTLADPAGYWTALVIAELLVFACTGPVNSAVVSEVPAGMRASAMALCIFTIHILGDVPSPPLIGAISDARSLQLAVMLIPAAVLVGGVIWCWAAWSGRAAQIGPTIESGG
ncbi:MAG TPA: MFS transporter [Gemmatimonadaceae bacterium]|nr:MFS transporter [Gemmatimonadaceae bacterium]